MSISPVYGAASQQQMEAAPSALEAEGLTPASLGGALLWLPRYHFSAASRIVAASLKARVWSTADGVNSAADAALVIEPASKWKADAVQQRPGIFLRRQTWELQPLGMFGSIYQNNQNTDVDRVERQTVGSHTFFCVSKLDAEADALAWELAGQLEGFSVNIIRDLGLTTFRVMQLPDAARLEESETHWVVPVTVAYAFSRAWTTKQMTIPVAKYTVSAQEN